MSGVRSLLKAVNDAVRSQRYDDAVETAQELLKKDPKNYQGLILLAFALDKQDKLAAAEKIYDEASKLKPQDPLAWRGLIKLYEKQGAARLAEYHTAAVNLIQAFAQGGDDEAHRCREVADKFVEHARAHGDEMQYAAALEIRLPESLAYGVLEGLVPPPAQTYEAIAHIIEKCEKTRINQEIGDRRTRIGARLGEVTLAVKREVYAQSKLEFLYRRLVDWTRDDDLRRSYEEKLFQYCYDRLLVLPAGEHKARERQMVLGLANDMVVIKHPYKLAWDVAIDWQDHKDIQGWDAELLRNYCAFFPDSDLYKAITAFMTSPYSPFPAASPDAEQEKKKKEKRNGDESSTEESEDDDDEGGVPTCFVPLTEEDRLIMMLEGAGTESVFAYRLAGQYFLRSGEYETTVEYMRKALPFVEGERQRTGFPFANSKDACSLSLATALIYYQTPRHHQEAKALFDAVLERDVTSTSALIGVGLIYEEEEEYEQAIDFLGRALARDGTDLRVRSEAAWVKALAGDWETARVELQQCLELLLAKETPKTKEPPNKELLADTQYRLGTCIWNLDASPQARKQRKGECAYSYWLAALNNHLSHAPAYTSLGIFYADYARDKKRARRCFQKALELSAAEVVAAERLARSFADDGDWDRVELVAQRVVDSGKVKPPPGSKRKGISWPFAALGVAELNKQDFHRAIVSFQAALRIAPEDYHSWVGLGESYCSSGRYMAATKAILNAKKLEEDGKVDAAQDSWFTDYMLANVKRELGEYDESIALYRAVLGARADEEGVILALLQTMVDSAVTSVEKGLFGKAVELAIDTINFAAAKTSEGGSICGAFNFWKSVAEACSVFSMVQSRLSEFPANSVRSLLERCSPEAFDILASADKVTADAVLGKENGAKGGESTTAADAHKDVDLDLARCLQATILCYKQAIHVCVDDFHAQAVAYYNLGWAEFRAHSCLPAQQRRKAGRYARASMRAFKRAIELEARNADFWNALGVVTSQINAQIAQHAFVRSLHLNERSPVAWANLGTLALLAGDVRLANEAFTRAQSTDPDYAHAWLGQGFVALLCGDVREARGLFTHAMEISEASSLPARRHYSAALFDHVLTAPSGLDVASLIEPLFAVNQIQGLQPDDIAFAHLSALFRERTRESGRAVKTLEQICAKMEADYEESESPESLARFTLAKTDLARAYLASGSYDDAVECGEMALGLSGDGGEGEGEGELTSEQRKWARLSAHLTVGLARYFLKQFNEAETCFEAASGESDNDPDAACLLAQVLWAQGTEAARDRARGALFDVIEKHPLHVQSVLLLGVIALLDEDEASLEAVVEELQGLRTDAKVTASEQSRIGEVLRAIAAPKEEHSQDHSQDQDDNQDQDRQEMLAQVQTDIMLYPHQPHGWLALAETAGEGGEHPALVGLRVAARAVPPRGALGADGLAKAYAGTGRVGDAQTSAFLAPWARDGWTALEAAVEGV